MYQFTGQSGPSRTDSGGDSSNAGYINFGQSGGSQGINWQIMAALAGVGVLYLLITKKKGG